MSVPQTPSSVDPGPAGSFKWKGLNWNVVSYQGGPAANVVRNSDGTITFKMTGSGGSHIVSTKGGLGYGDYTIVVDSDLAALPRGVVWGGHFPYDNSDGSQEMDNQESSTWGGGAVTMSPHHWKTDDSAQVNAIHSGGSGPSSNPFQVPSGGPWCNVTKWRNGRVDYEIYRALDASDPSKLYWKGYSTTGVPVPKNSTVQHINLWNSTSTCSVHVVDFSFVPVGAVVDPNPTPTPVPTSAPGPAANVHSESVTATTATLAWAPGSGSVTGYEVSIKGSGWNGDQAWTNSLPATARSFQFGNLTSGTTFTLGVTPLNGNARGPASAVSVKAGSPTPTPTPTPAATLPNPVPGDANLSTVITSFNKLLTYLQGREGSY